MGVREGDGEAAREGQGRDGERVGRKIVRATDYAPFGSRRFEIRSTRPGSRGFGSRRATPPATARSCSRRADRSMTAATWLATLVPDCGCV